MLASLHVFIFGVLYARSRITLKNHAPDTTGLSNEVQTQPIKGRVDGGKIELNVYENPTKVYAAGIPPGVGLYRRDAFPDVRRRDSFYDAARF